MIYPAATFATSDFRHTISVMQEVMDRMCADQTWRWLAVRIVGAAPSFDRAGESWMIQNWIAKNVRYRRDPISSEWVQYPDVTIDQRAGDCDDMALLAGTLLQAIGHPCSACAVRWKGHHAPSHAVIYDMLSMKVVDPVSNLPLNQWPPRGYEVAELIGAKL